MKMNITFDQAIEGYLIDARARQLSPKTIADYLNSFRHFRNWLALAAADRGSAESVLLNEITRDDIRSFLAWLADVEITPTSIAEKPAQALSKKSVKNVHCGLSALWTWAIQEEIVEAHIVRAVQAPRPSRPVIEPFSKTEIDRLLEACKCTASYTQKGTECTMARPTATRDRAIILTLLDTGARSGEIFQSRMHPDRYARINDLNRDNMTITVWGKGDKQRVLRISHSTMRAIWRYLVQRDCSDDDALFASSTSAGPLTQNGLSHFFKRLGERAGVEDVHAHRFRHTFAISFLRNGGKTLELQRILGHTSLQMVERYVRIAEVDLENAHRRASPVSNWNL